MFSLPKSNICQVASDLDVSAAGLDPKYVLTLLYWDFAIPIFDLSSSFFRDWYWPATRKCWHHTKRRKTTKTDNFRLHRLSTKKFISWSRMKSTPVSIFWKGVEVTSKFTRTKWNLIFWQVIELRVYHKTTSFWFWFNICEHLWQS